MSRDVNEPILDVSRDVIEPILDERVTSYCSRIRSDVCMYASVGARVCVCVYVCVCMCVCVRARACG